MEYETIGNFKEDGYTIIKKLIPDQRINGLLQNISQLYLKFSNDNSKEIEKLKEPFNHNVFHQKLINFRKDKPELFAKVGIKPPKGVLMVGPPGCGKTMLAKAVAQQTDATFIRMVGSELAQKYIGEGGRMVRELFSLAKDKAPSIIFLDEIDAIGAKRLDGATSGDREVQRTLMQLLAELDGFDSLEDVKIIAATNRPDILDEALMRPGRFDRIIDIPVPDVEGRKSILTLCLKSMSKTSFRLGKIVEKTENFSGAELKAVCVEAGMIAIRQSRARITQKDMFTAIDRVVDKRHNKSGREGLRVLYG